jgi:hypothetical protein
MLEGEPTFGAPFQLHSGGLNQSKLAPGGWLSGSTLWSWETGSDPWSIPGVSGVATDREGKHPVHIVPNCAPPNRHEDRSLSVEPTGESVNQIVDWCDIGSC